MEILDFFIEKKGENRYKLTFNNKSYERQFTSFFKKNLEIIENLEKLGRKLTQEEEHKYSNTLSLIGDEIGLFLFPEGIKEQVKKIFDNAVANDKKIIIKISSDDPSVHDIPFELVRFGGEYLVKKPNFYLVRDVPSISHLKREIKGLKEKLKILVILSLPLEEYESSPLDLLEEVDNIYKVLEPEIEKGTVEVYIEDRANTNTIRKILENESFDIVHYTGHGTEGGYLLFEDEHDFKKGKLVSIVEFRNMFKIKQPDLFFLDACLTAKSGYGKPSLAFELYEDFENSHIVANITTVADREATQGARFFYKNLIEKKSLAEVLSDNRISLKNDWWKGVIFTPKPEQVLFNVSEKTELKKEKKIRKIEDAQQLIKEYVYRFEIIRNASQKIEESNTRYLAFYGIGGMGKTYLMKYFSWFYQGRFDNIIYFDLKEEKIKTLSDLIRKIIREMAKVKLISAEEYKNLVETIKTTDEEFIIDIVLPEIFERLKGKTLLILDNLEEIGQDREGLLKDGWREFVEEWNGKPENFLFLATRVKIFKTQREEFENYIVIDEFNWFDVARFIRKLANSEEELNGFIDYLNSHSAEIDEFIGYHPLALKLLILNKPADVLEVLNFREIKSLFEFYRQYLQEFKENFKILLLLHNRFSMELVSKLGIDINLIHLLKNRLFVLKEDGKYLNISKIFRSYFRNDREFKLTGEEGYKLWKKLKPLLDNPDFVSSNSEAVLLLLMGILEATGSKEVEERFFGLKNLSSLFLKSSSSVSNEEKHLSVEPSKKLFEITDKLDQQKVTELFNNLGVLYRQKGELDKAEEYYLNALKIREKIPPEDHPHLATTYLNLGVLYRQKGELDKAEKYFLKALKIREKILPKEHPDLATSYLNLGNLYRQKGDLDKAKEYYEKALKIFEKIPPEDHPDLAGTYLNLGVLYSDKGELNKAEKYYLKALKIREKILPEDHPDLARTYLNLGVLYSDKGELNKAEKYYLKALKIREKILPEDHPDLAGTYLNLGVLYAEKGKLDKAEEYLLKALKIFEKILPEDHPDLARTYLNLGNLYSDKGELNKAEKYYLKALKIFEKIPPEDHPDLARTYLNLGNLYSDKGELNKAEKYYLKALKIREKILPEDHPDLARTYLNLGVLYAEKGKLDKAEEYLLKALKIREKILPEDHPDLASSYLNLGVLYAEKGKLDKAEEYLLKALKIREKILPEDHPDLASSYLNLGVLYAEKGKLGKAEEYFLKALKVYKKGGYIKDYLELIPLYIDTLIKSSDFSLVKLYKALCEYFEVLFHNQREKLTEIQIGKTLKDVAEIIVNNKVELDGEWKFASGVCEEFYKKRFLPVYGQLKDDLNAGASNV